jgi:hypothetical protein
VPTFFDSAPNTVRPEKPKLNLKCDMFGTNVLEDDDRKNSLSPALNKQQKLYHNISAQSMMGANMTNNQMKAAGISKLLDESLFANAGINQT